MLKIYYLKSRDQSDITEAEEKVRMDLSVLGDIDQKIDDEFVARHYQLLAVTSDAPLEATFAYFQGENWSPNGEARELIRSLELDHTSMSVGDMIEVSPSGDRYLVKGIGFTKV